MFVSNLSFHTVEDDLKTLFSQYGSVSSVKVIKDRESGRSRGFGFVEMDSAEEANNAIKALNGKDIEGRALSVSVAREKSSNSGDRRF